MNEILMPRAESSMTHDFFWKKKIILRPGWVISCFPRGKTEFKKRAESIMKTF